MELFWWHLIVAFVAGAIAGNQFTTWHLNRLMDNENIEVRYKDHE